MEGLRDRPRSGRRPRLNAEQLAELARLVEEGPDIAVHRVVCWRCVDLQAEIKARFDVELSERQVGRLLGQLRFTRLSVRPRHPQADESAQQTFKKLRRPGERGTARRRPRRSRSGSRTKRIGQKGTLTRLWARICSRPRAPRDSRYEWATCSAPSVHNAPSALPW